MHKPLCRLKDAVPSSPGAPLTPPHQGACQSASSQDIAKTEKKKATKITTTTKQKQNQKQASKQTNEQKQKN